MPMNETEAIQEIMDIQIRDIRTKDDENQLRHRIFQSLIEMEIMEEAKNKILLKLINLGVNYRYNQFTEYSILRNFDLPNNWFAENDPPKFRYLENWKSFKPRDPRLEKELFGNVVPGGINFDQYDDIPVDTSGENVPEPIKESYFFLSSIYDS